MNRIFIKNIVTFIVFFSVNFAVADVAVIVHPSNSAAIELADVAKIFLGKSKQFSSGETAIPITSSGAKTDDFIEKVMERSSQQYKAYWSKRMFSGKGNPPQNLLNDSEVLSIVSRNPNTIGYVDPANVTDDVKVLFIK